MTGHLLSYLLIFVVLVLAACEGGGTNSSLAIPAPHVPTGAMQTYTSFDYTLRYPAGWKEGETLSGWVAFTDPTGYYALAIRSWPNPEGRISAENVAAYELLTLQESKPVHLPPTILLARQHWSQKAAIGWVYWHTGHLVVEMVSLATNPTQDSGTVTYSIVYDAPVAKFDQAAKLYFTPMLQSFSFTA